MPKGEEALLTVGLTVVLESQRGSGKNQSGLGHVEPALDEGILPLRFVELDVHLMLLQKIVKRWWADRPPYAASNVIFRRRNCVALFET
jgi:hypothetical protein